MVQTHLPVPTASSDHDELVRQQSTDWKDATKRETEGALSDELDRLLQTAFPHDVERWRKEFNGFKNLFARFLRAKPEITWNRIEPLPEGAIRDYASIEVPKDSLPAAQLLQKLVVVKLNGGLGTSMGCKGPKSIIPVRDDLTFLDLTLQQIESLNKTYGVDVPLVLMNSFNTDDDTQKILRKYRNVRASVFTFNQSRYPRLNKETLMPIAKTLATNNDLEAWYPPGHGNLYEALYNSGLLEKFISQNKEYCFISNVDNLGATVDLNILNFLLNGAGEKPEFVMELTEKTRADVKGGTLIKYDGRLMLLEVAQVPKNHMDDFKSVSKFKIFNTNNLWCNLKAMKSKVESNALEMEIIVNPKHLDQGIDVVQLETAAGAAIKNFKGALGITVPRRRFLPVKKTQDLLLIMSNLYDLVKGHLCLSAERQFLTTPLVKLGSEFDKVNDFLKRFRGIPDIIELDHLTVSGDVTFGKGVSLKGTVIIIANHGERIDIPANALLENKIVSGNLRIMDH